VTNIIATTDRQHWVARAIVLGIVYCALGVIFARMAGYVGGGRATVAWRLAAWVGSAIIFAAHIVYEQFRLRNSTGVVAFHAATAAAVGAFGLAVMAAFHRAWSSPSGAPLHLYALALVAWPLITGLPAFVVALVVSAVLARLSPQCG
jgi:hypothetical protein